MKLATIERTKLLANALDRASTVCLTVGVAGPIAALAFGTAHVRLDWLSGLYVSIWVLCGLGFHAYARKVLKGLPDG